MGASLVRLVEERLRAGPTPTDALAREVLGISGHAGAAAAAVYALLGDDSRFRVDPAGVWSLRGDAGLGPPLEALDFAVVDVETTGGGPHRGHRMTEIAIVHVAGGEIRDEFTTLLNPGRSIPPFVASLTGITGDMVSGAPYFEHVADVVADCLEGRIFVAHNARFDAGFVRAELAEALGVVPVLETLCTVQLARALLPRLRRRNLDALTQHFGIRIHGRHRAAGDALATARVLLRLLDEARLQGVHDLDALNTLLARRSRRRGPRDRRAGSDLGPDTPEES
ncbi:MAG: exonuclease domain-containing protein [Longimicrobiales bacterium]|nr:exonuclease domain-containing protein [Longimicrobiales bacterium]